MEIIVVNDTNIFIDLMSVDLLDDFFRLPIEIHTTDFVLNELTDESQHNAIQKHISLKHLTVKGHSGAEVAAIVSFQETCRNNVSIADCSVWLYAKYNGYTLLTGDAKLRSSAQKSGVNVCGILRIFGNKITIGNNVLIAPNVQIYTATHPIKLNERLTPTETPDGIEYVRHTYALPVTIEDGCWIGGGVIILPGVTIGRGSVIGAGSVVTKSIPANTLAAGNPCKVIRKINIQHEQSQI